LITATEQDPIRPGYAWDMQIREAEVMKWEVPIIYEDYDRKNDPREVTPVYALP
jgi:hypothetical protein